MFPQVESMRRRRKTWAVTVGVKLRHKQYVLHTSDFMLFSVRSSILEVGAQALIFTDTRKKIIETVPLFYVKEVLT